MTHFFSLKAFFSCILPAVLFWSQGDFGGFPLCFSPSLFLTWKAAPLCQAAALDAGSSGGQALSQPILPLLHSQEEDGKWNTETKDDKCLPPDGLSPLPLIPWFHHFIGWPQGPITASWPWIFLSSLLAPVPEALWGTAELSNEPRDSLIRTGSGLWKPPLSLDQQTKSIPHFFYSVFKQSLCVVNRYLPAGSDYSHEIKRCLLLGRKTMTNLDSVLKSRHHFANKGPYSQSYGFSSGRVWMWELGHKNGWVLKNLCFWTVVLEKTLESPLDSNEIKQVSPKENQPWMFIGRTDAEAEAPIPWPPDVKSQLTGKDHDSGKDWGQEENGMTEDEMVW